MNEDTPKPHRPRGTGRLYQQNSSPNWMIQYYRNGTVHRESSGTSDRRKAEKFLQKRLAEVSTGNFIGPRIEKIRVSELADDLLRQFRTGEIKGKKSLAWAERRWNLHLKPFFGDLRAVQVGTDLLSRYVEERQAAKAANATINREMAFLRRAFQRGLEARPPKVYIVPPFTVLTEDNVRKGFLEDAQYDKLAAECAKEGLWLRAMLAVAYNFGWRKSELNLRVEQVDLVSRTIRLEVGTTKNNSGRTVKMTDEVYTLLAACISGKSKENPVFTREDGSPVIDFRKTWRNVCVRAGVAGLLLHDLRRSGARNLRRLGVGESTIMKIGGWKTRSVFMRYDIVSEADLDDAARRLNEKKIERSTERDQEVEHISSIVEPSQPVVANANSIN